MDQLIQSLQSIVGADSVLSAPDELLVYECDGLPQHKHPPRAVVLPESTEATAEVMRTLARFGVPFTPRGAGTGLSGGALALNHGVIIELARMRRILSIDPENRTAQVQTGVVNLHVSRAVARLGLHYVPDPSSQPTCTIGGNIAENAGGIHCLKYGTTTDHVLAARVVLSTGDVVDLQSGEKAEGGYDLLGLFVGSEGTFGIATEATLRLTPLPPAVRTLLAEFPTVDAASQAVSAIIAAGVMPAALEMMDREIIRAIEASIFTAGLPTDIGAALLIELDGVEAGIDEEAERVKSICLVYGARSCRLARDENERKKLWAARKGAFGAIGRIAPDSMIQDAVVPRSKLPEIMEQSYRIAAKYQLVLANVFHAGDGNLHPLICFDSRSPDQVLRVKEAGRELMETCVRAGGSITGEHGVGLDKRDYLPLIFSPDDMQAMLAVRHAFDPIGLLNPGKIIPMLRGCGEGRAVASAPTNGNEHEEPSEMLATTPSANQQSIASITPHATAGSNSALNSAGSSFHLLAAILGEEHITTPLSSSDSMVAFPGTAAELAELMKFASKNRWRVLPSGTGNWLQRHPQSSDNVQLVINTTRMNRVIEHEPADLIATAQAGVALRDFNDSLGLQGQWLALDPPDNGSATLGGVVATGQAGAQRLGYGPPRRHVVGLSVVLADGREIKMGGRVVKNVAGYDLSKLFTGSFGTLGIITELTFKLRPIPAYTGTVVLAGPLVALTKAGTACVSARKPSRTKIFPVAAEFISPQIASACGFSALPNHILLVRFAGAKEMVLVQMNTLATAVEEVDELRLEQLSPDDEETWRTVSSLPFRYPDSLIVRTTLKPSTLPAFLTDWETELNWQASAGTGVVRLFAKSVNEEDDRALIERLYRASLENGGKITIDNSPSVRNVGFKQPNGPLVELGERIKHELDPQNTLPAIESLVQT